MTDVEELTVTRDATIGEAMETIDELGHGIALVVADDGTLIDTVTDGDIRRSLLEEAELDSPIVAALDAKSQRAVDGPITASTDQGRREKLRLLEEHDIEHLPVLDEEGTVAELATREDLRAPPEPPVDARGVVMAGGYGTRLRPLTEDTPKPMLPVGDRPLLEHLVEGLADDGIREITLTTHYRADQIREHFDDRASFDAEISYIHEEEPLGTAGFLGELKSWERDLLVVNGDVLTDASFQQILAFHDDHDADITVAVQEHELEVPYGTLEMDGLHITGLREKPSLSFFINAGIYVLSPSISELTPEEEMTELIKEAMRRDLEVVGYPLEARWIDIGEPEDYKEARRRIAEFDM